MTRAPYIPPRLEPLAENDPRAVALREQLAGAGAKPEGKRKEQPGP